MVTLKEIAAEAGVSIMTVSNVIRRNYARVSPATVKKVQAIIDQYNYVPNLAARSLSAHRSHIVILMLPRWNDPKGNLLADPYISQMTGLLEMLLRVRGYYVMLCSFSDVGEAVTLQKNWQADGCIMVLPHTDEVTRDVARRSTIPLVVIDRNFEDMDLLAVNLDDFGGCYRATSYLISRGHRKIAFGCPLMSVSSVLKDRYDGYVKALADHGIAPDARYLFDDRNFLEGGEKIAESICAMSDPPTALVTTQDLIACGAIGGMQKRGKQVPRDLSVVGFDDSLPARLVTPPLTSISQDVPGKAEAAVTLLLDAIADRAARKRNVVIDVSLVERDSVRDI